MVKKAKKTDLLAHHANLLIGGESTHEQLLTRLKEDCGVTIHGDPDFIDQSFDAFTVDDSRELKALASTKPVKENGRKIFVVMIKQITIEAQNALLKLLEEPAEYAVFFIIIPSRHQLIPTITSRLNDLSDKFTQRADDHTDAESFLKLSAPKKLEFIKKLVDDIGKEKKTRQDAVDFLNGVESIVYEKRGVKQAARSLQAIEMARKYMNDRAPSVKMLLEYVSLNI